MRHRPAQYVSETEKFRKGLGSVLMITTTMSGDGRAGEVRPVEECAKAEQGPHTFILACQRDTMFKDKTHVRTHVCCTVLQSILDFAHTRRRKPTSSAFSPFISTELIPLICLSRCQWLVADVTTCCDQAAHQVITRGLPGHSVIRHLAQSWNVGPQRDQTHKKTSHGSSLLLVKLADSKQLHDDSHQVSIYLYVD